MLHARTGATHPKLNKKVHGVLDHIDSTMKAMRAIINNLRPTVLDLGLNAAIEWQVKEFQRRTGIACELIMPPTELVMDDGRATALFRIVQESLNNVFRHARATKANIELELTDSRLQMKISDNGVGIFPGCRHKANSFGLVGIKERVSTLGGEFEIQTGQDIGTTLSVAIPLDDAIGTANSGVDSSMPAVLFDRRASDALDLKIGRKRSPVARRKKESDNLNELT